MLMKANKKRKECQEVPEREQRVGRRRPAGAGGRLRLTVAGGQVMAARNRRDTDKNPGLCFPTMPARLSVVQVDQLKLLGVDQALIGQFQGRNHRQGEKRQGRESVLQPAAKTGDGPVDPIQTILDL